MQSEPIIQRTLREIIATRTGTIPTNLVLERKRFGGTEATETALVTARFRDHRDRPAMLKTVVKQLDGRPAREAAIYRDLVATHAAEMAPRLLQTKELGPQSTIIFLEAVRRVNSWPWRDSETTSDMLTRLGRFHASVRTSRVSLPEWDSERELAHMSEHTWDLLDRCREQPGLAGLTRGLRPLDRLIQAMPRLRRQLFSEQPFGWRPIHGDVHPGNALVRRRNGTCEPILIDWGRARLGSPLEDLSSWLQTLRFYEPEAERLHDTLFRRYLSAFGMPRKLTQDIRAAYWIAGASNALSGALVHHLAVVMDERQSPSAHADAYHAARCWLRIIRRAHAWTM